MENRLIVLYLIICEVVTERANTAAYWMAVEARYQRFRKIRVS